MAENTVRLAVYGHPAVELEGYVSASETEGIYPGMVLKLTVDGSWIRHDTKGGFCSKHFSYEAVLSGKAINTPYMPGQKMNIIKARPGDLLWLVVDEVFSVGDIAISSGDGTVEAIPPPGTSDESSIGIVHHEGGPSAPLTRTVVEIV